MDDQGPRIEETKTVLRKHIVDEDFTPPVDMMVHDYDDEQTLEEEEALGALEDPQVELSSLEKEGKMPLEDLIAMYGYDNGSEENKSTEENSEKKSDPSELEQLYNDNEEINVRSTRYGSRAQSEDDDDDDYSPEESRKKTIMVGSDYQAQIPEGLCKYDDALPYENEDKLVWDPRDLSPKEIEDYLIRASEPAGSGISGIPIGIHTRDDEGALFLLLQCGYNFDEALRRLKLSTPAQASELPLWSEEECKHFEAGLRTFGKDFRLIQLNKVRTRSVGELVQFYYLWKKTERHDIFANKARLGKKKYSLHPGVTDYMERFLEGDERPRTESPSIHSLLYGDHKWRSEEDVPTVKEEKTDK
ncbi:mesoderm induction early response protein 1 [Halyomorpha halys]|uniref:mesoderm induction early response protein 1 n=1 Tax=Halyomorpha halys TaxID=286706 RepID=UPI0006D51353|nr:mesoderm induction early response protein 1 [Halyomorpha halys]